MAKKKSKKRQAKIKAKLCFEQNEGPIDRTIRTVLGIAALFLGYASSAWWYIPAAILLVTGITGFCSIYRLFDINTKNF